MKQQLLEDTLSQIRGIIEDAFASRNYVIAVSRIKELLNKAHIESPRNYEVATEHQQGASLRGDILNKGSGQ